MKIRKDFVTNSSSSSYVCEICGETNEGYDMSITEAGMYECENGHVFCQYHTSVNEISRTQKETIINGRNGTPKSSLKEMDMDEINEQIQNIIDEDPYDIPEELCPICQFREIKPEDMIRFMMKEEGLKKSELLTMCSRSFKNYEEFLKYINEK